MMKIHHSFLLLQVICEHIMLTQRTPDGLIVAIFCFILTPTTVSALANHMVHFGITSIFSAGSTEQGYIRAAIAKFQSQMKGCLTFVETTASDLRFKVHVTPYVSGFEFLPIHLNTYSKA